MIISYANSRSVDHPGYYQKLLSFQKNYPEYFFANIEKDIERTLPNGHENQKALRNVLYGYGIRNPFLLYCQGMNYFVSYLLMNGFQEE